MNKIGKGNLTGELYGVRHNKYENENIWSDEDKYWTKGSIDGWISLRNLIFKHTELYLTEFSNSLQIWKANMRSFISPVINFIKAKYT